MFLTIKTIQTTSWNDPWWLLLFTGIGLTIVLVAFLLDLLAYFVKRGQILFYPFGVLEQACLGIKELFSIKPGNLKRIEHYERMGGKQALAYTGIYLAVAALMLWLVMYTGNIPGCQHAKDMLR